MQLLNSKPPGLYEIALTAAELRLLVTFSSALHAKEQQAQEVLFKTLEGYLE